MKTHNFKVSFPETFCFMRSLLQFYQHINILSLDVVAGALAGALFFAKIFNAEVSLWSLAALGLTVWIVYTVDHLRDAMSIRSIAATDRHRFHQKYFSVIFRILVGVIALDLVIVWFVEQEVFQLGVLLGLIVVLYLVLQRYLKFLKEFFVAFLYTAGILLPTISWIDPHLLPVHYILIVKYFITAWMNLLLFSLIDYNADKEQKQHSFVTWFGPRSTRVGILALGLINILSGMWLWSFDPQLAVIFVSMNVVLLCILVFQNHLVHENYYRIGGDAVFLIPLFYLL